MDLDKISDDWDFEWELYKSQQPDPEPQTEDDIKFMKDNKDLIAFYESKAPLCHGKRMVLFMSNNTYIIKAYFCPLCYKKSKLPEHKL